MEILERLFGSAVKVKVLRLFLCNPDKAFTTSDVSERVRSYIEDARSEVNALHKIGFLRKRAAPKIRPDGTRRRSTHGWALNQNFPYLTPLRNFLIYLKPLTHTEIYRRVNHTGRIRLLIASGIFIQDWESRVDLFIVGEGIRRKALETAMKKMESEVGMELKYTVFDTEDFKYRHSMCDKLVRDVLDYPHEVIVDKLEVSEKAD